MRRRMKMESVPVRIHDLGSLEGCCLDFGREELWERLDAPLAALAVRLPVYLVSEVQMDCLYPPKRHRFFLEDRLRERLRRLRERDLEEDEDPFAPSGTWRWRTGRPGVGRRWWWPQAFTSAAWTPASPTGVTFPASGPASTA